MPAAAQQSSLGLHTSFAFCSPISGQRAWQIAGTGAGSGQTGKIITHALSGPKLHGDGLQRLVVYSL